MGVTDPRWSDERHRVGFVAASAACVDVLGGQVWAPALELAVQEQTYRSGVSGPSGGSRTAGDIAAALVSLARARQVDPAAIGGVSLAVLDRAYRSSPEVGVWIPGQLGEWLSTVPGVHDPAFVTALLDLSEQFTGTPADLVAAASAIVS